MGALKLSISAEQFVGLFTEKTERHIEITKGFPEKTRLVDVRFVDSAIDGGGYVEFLLEHPSFENNSYASMRAWQVPFITPELTIHYCDRLKEKDLAKVQADAVKA